MTWNPKLFPPTEVDTIVERACSYPAQAIVITGGEPSLYPLDYLTDALAKKGLQIFLETSGAHELSGHFDWICLSPKKQQPPVPSIFPKADELKVIIETPGDFAWAEENAAKVGERCRLYLQPEWSRYDGMIEAIVEYAKGNPQWNISVQTHKYMRLP